MIWLVMVGGLYSILLSLVIRTQDIPSALVFKFLPFVLGLSCVLYSAKELDII